MTAIRYVESGIKCNYGDCLEMLLASQCTDDNGISAVRKAAEKRGWRTGVEDKRETGARRTPRLDYCPAHSGENGSLA